jgi:hypothetical protein
MHADWLQFRWSARWGWSNRYCLRCFAQRLEALPGVVTVPNSNPGAGSVMPWPGGGGGGGGGSIGALSDVQVSNPQNGQVLTWNASLGKWVNQSPTGGGGGGAVDGAVITAEKTVDTSRASNATPTVDPDLQITLPGAGTYYYKCVLSIAVGPYPSGPTGDTPGYQMCMNFSNPGAWVWGGGEFYYGYMNGEVNATWASGPQAPQLPTGMFAQFALLGGVNNNMLVWEGTATVSGAGVLGVQWAQRNSSANATIVKAHSVMWVKKVEDSSGIPTTGATFTAPWQVVQPGYSPPDNHMLWAEPGGQVGLTSWPTGNSIILEPDGGGALGTPPKQIQWEANAATGYWIPGTTTNNDAAPGFVGEYIHQETTWAAVTSGAFTNTTSVTLTAGDWDVLCTGSWRPSATTSFNLMIVGASGISQALGTDGTHTDLAIASQVEGGNVVAMTTPRVRFNLAASATIYCVQQAVFTGSVECKGVISARRVR